MNNTLLEFRFSYDDLADVLYLNVGPKVKARVREDAQGILWKVDATGHVVGATVQAVHRWSSRPVELVDQLSHKLSVSRAQIEASLPH